MMNSAIRTSVETFSNLGKFVPPLIRDKWRPVIGLEIHAQILSQTKLFARVPTNTKAPPNTQVGIFEAAHPGTLPVLNKKCVEAAVQTALALGSNINPVSRFDRKHYFYPDIPAGYQITQRDHPIASKGVFRFTVQESDGLIYDKDVSITQIQLEEDTGKMLHNKESNRMLVDLNRAGMPLMELVFGPDLQTAQEAVCLVRDLTIILKKLNACSCRMSEGALRVDVNVSVHKPNEPLGVRTELKNIRDVKDIYNAINYEIDRQINLLENGDRVINETRTYNSDSQITLRMRDKEVFQDYRFMPEPNLPPLRLTNSAENKEINCKKSLDISHLVSSIPDQPANIRQYLITKYNLESKDVYEFGSCYEGVEILDDICSKDSSKDPLLCLNLISECVTFNGGSLARPVPRWITKEIIEELLGLRQSGKLSLYNVQNVVNILEKETGNNPSQIAQENGWMIDVDALNAELKAKLDVMFKNPETISKIQKLKSKGKKKRLDAFLKKLLDDVFIATKKNIDRNLIKEEIAKKINEI